MSEQEIRILLHIPSFANKGDEAMTRTIQSEMRQRFENITFFVEPISVRPGTEALIANAGLKILYRSTNGVLIDLEFAKQMLRMPRKIRKLWQQRKHMVGCQEVVRKVDIILDASGYTYAPIWGYGPVLRATSLAKAARRANIPYIFLAQCWGPFNNSPRLNRLYREMLEQATLVIARDKQSQANVLSLLQKPGQEIVLAPDMAFRFQSAGREVGKRLLREHGLDTDQPIVALAPNMRVYERTEGKGIDNRYVQIMTDAAGYFLERGIQVLLVPHEIKANHQEKMDDRSLCELILQKIGEQPKIASIRDMMSSEDMKAMIACCELLFGSRFHSIIAALQSRVPVVVIGWAHKYTELLKDVGLEDYGFEYTQPLDDLDEILGAAWENRATLSQKIDQRVSVLEAEVSQMFDRVASYLPKST
ncbi:MAG: polysaccharide pyruvyl transferase family protein [Chloroflexota bacterium]